MTYSELVESAPPGAASFGPADLRRLPPGVFEELLATAPPDDRRLLEAEDQEAARRLIRAGFWTLVYYLRPERWDALSRAEPIHPGVLAALPADGARVLEVAAGTGRLTVDLAARARSLIAIEPVAPLRKILQRRLPDIAVLDGIAAFIPVAKGWADLTVSCASLGPDLAELREAERCTRRGGTHALISPSEPEWFERRGYRYLRFNPSEIEIPPHDPDLEQFFGPLKPPHELLLKVL
jgi:hypothetical protein